MARVLLGERVRDGQDATGRERVRDGQGATGRERVRDGQVATGRESERWTGCYWERE